MKYLILSICFGCLMGCSSTKQVTTTSAPQLLMHQPLPLLPESIEKPPSNLDLSLLIAEDGSVVKVQLLSGSGSASWDSLAATTIRQWRFVPARIKDEPISTWFRIQASIQYAIPHYISLAEILCTTMEEADSIYDYLRQGHDFSELAIKHATGSSSDQKRVLGKIDINSYPKSIRNILARLDLDEFSKPLKYGDQYVIFKRLKD